MAESEAEIESLAAALRNSYEALSRELSEIEDQERQSEISATLSTIKQQIQDLEEGRQELRRAGVAERTPNKR